MTVTWDAVPEQSWLLELWGTPAFQVIFTHGRAEEKGLSVC